MTPRFLIGSLIIWKLAPLSAGIEKHDQKLGYDYVHEIVENQSIESTLSLEENLKYQFDNPLVLSQFKGFLRLIVDSERPDTYKTLKKLPQIEKWTADLEKHFDQWKIIAGHSEITWGENILLPVLDIVNPRDALHPKGYYDPAAKIPLYMARAEYEHEGHRLQLIYVPLAARGRDPEYIGQFQVDPRTPYKAFRHQEYGLRAGKLLNSLDLNFYAYRYHNRVPSYKLVALPNPYELENTAEVLHTQGLSLSTAAFDTTYKFDLARHSSLVGTNISRNPETSPVIQSSVGLTWINEAQESLGVEAHFDFWEKAPVAFEDSAFVIEQKGPKFLSWIGTNSQFKGLNEASEFSLMAYLGLMNSDRLFRIGHRYNIDNNQKINLDWTITRANIHTPKLYLGQRHSLGLKWDYSF